MGVKFDYGICRDCGAKRTVRHKEWIRASPPKCYRCGGRLEPSAQAEREHTRHNIEAHEQKEAAKRKTGR